jgi:hypothetical protein
LTLEAEAVVVVDMAAATLAAVAPRYTEVVVVMEGPIEASEELAQSGVSVETAGFTEVAAFTVGVEARVEVVDIQSLQFLAKDSSVDKPDRAILREARFRTSSV